MKKPLTWEKVAYMATKALAHGGERKSPSVIEWNVAGRCQAPRYFEMLGRPTAGLEPAVVGVDAWGTTLYHPRLKTSCRTVLGGLKGERIALEVRIWTRCRRCDNCRRMRAARWRSAASAETDASARTWFGTLTLRPEEHYRFLCKATENLTNKADSAALEDADALFKARVAAMSRDIGAWLKRVRKESGAPLRYLLVTEAHKSGLPHLHVLVHQVHPDRPVLKDTLQRQWLLGFSAWKLVADKRQATYVTKYLSKSNLARVRASLRYGEQPEHALRHRSLVQLRPNLDHKITTPTKMPGETKVLDASSVL